MKPLVRNLAILTSTAMLFSCGQKQNTSSGVGAFTNHSFSSSQMETSSSSAPILESDSQVETITSSREHSSKTYTRPNSYDEMDDFIQTSDGTVLKAGNVYYLTTAGSYSIIGERFGQVIVDAGDEDVVEIDLNGVTLSYDLDSPIKCMNADKVEISAKSATFNSISDNRSLRIEEDESQGNGAIYAKCDLKLKGSGSLDVSAGYNNGIHTTKDLKVQKLTLSVTAPNNALKGNDSITISSGNISVTSTGGDGLKSEDSDISSKEKQRGTIQIDGGTLDIYSGCDAIDASYDVVINGGVINAKTYKYSPYTGEIVAPSTTTMYLRTTLSNSNTSRYAVYFYDDEGGFVWADASYKTSKRDRDATYYYYEVERPNNYGNFRIYRFNSESANSTTDYLAASRGATINTNFDTVSFSISGSTINTGNWSNYESGGSKGGGPGGPGERGNPDKTDFSTKGIKADNKILINGGTIDIQSCDDGIHANSDVTLGNGAQGVGDVEITNGIITIASDDDGIHGDRYTKISGGSINITKSYEGVEGNQILISGGETYVVASDDGVNSSSGTLSPLISVSGGYIFAAVPSSGDTDGFDSNGTISLTGGTTIACGPKSNFAASAFDAERGCTISGSDTTLILFGGAEASPRGFGKTTKSYSFSSGSSYAISYSDETTINTGRLISSYTSLSSWSSHGSVSSISVL